MLIALLAVLGVDLATLIVLVVIVQTRKAWVKRQPGAFQGAIRVASGDIDGLPPKWRRGYGRWVREVLVWTKAPFLFRNDLAPVDNLAEQRTARPDEVKRLGDDPAIVVLKVGTATVEVASHGEDSQHLVGPFRDGPGSPGARAEPSSKP